MSRTVTIPNDYDPFVININNVEYKYKAGTQVSVPDAVADLIDEYYATKPRAKEASIIDNGEVAFVKDDAGKVMRVNDAGTDVVWGKYTKHLPRVRIMVNSGYASGTWIPCSIGLAKKKQDSYNAEPFIDGASGWSVFLYLEPVLTGGNFQREVILPFPDALRDDEYLFVTDLESGGEIEGDGVDATVMIASASTASFVVTGDEIVLKFGYSS